MNGLPGASPGSGEVATLVTVNGPLFFYKECMKITRPPAENRKINSKDDFELCYLRHQYVRRVDYNPTQDEMAPYDMIVRHQVKRTYVTYTNLFKLVGIEWDDLLNIAKVHLVSYLGLFAITKVPKKYEEFCAFHVNKSGQMPSDWMIEKKNRANLTMFMKQRMEDVVRVCRQKAKNIKGMPTEEYFCFYGDKKPPKNVRKLLEDHIKYGYRKLDMASFKSIRKRVLKENRANRIKPIQPTKSHEILKFAGSYYISVPLEHRELSIVDFTGANLDPYDNIHNRTPEDLLLDRLDVHEYERKKRDFESQSDTRKETIVRNFIRKNKSNPLFKEEVQLARKFLEELRD